MDYKKRLAYGTDQGRWLMTEVDADIVKRPKTPRYMCVEHADVPSRAATEHIDDFLCLTAVVFFGFILGLAIIVIYM